MLLVGVVVAVVGVVVLLVRAVRRVAVLWRGLGVVEQRVAREFGRHADGGRRG